MIRVLPWMEFCLHEPFVVLLSCDIVYILLVVIIIQSMSFMQGSLFSMSFMIDYNYLATSRKLINHKMNIVSAVLRLFILWLIQQLYRCVGIKEAYMYVQIHTYIHT